MELLTQREREIANRIAVGQSHLQIAAQLFMNRGTLKAHVSNIYNKTGMGSAVELLTFLWAHPDYLDFTK